MQFTLCSYDYLNIIMSAAMTMGKAATAMRKITMASGRPENGPEVCVLVHSDKGQKGRSYKMAKRSFNIINEGHHGLGEGRYRYYHVEGCHGHGEGHHDLGAARELSEVCVLVHRDKVVAGINLVAVIKVANHGEGGCR